MDYYQIFKLPILNINVLFSSKWLFLLFSFFAFIGVIIFIWKVNFKFENQFFKFLFELFKALLLIWVSALVLKAVYLAVCDTEIFLALKRELINQIFHAFSELLTAILNCGFNS